MEPPDPKRTQTTRRKILQRAAGAGAASLALPRVASGRNRSRVRSERLRPPPRVDVAIVGAGLSGLTAAREVMRKGRSVIVLEARDRVGGRTLNGSIGGGKVVEMGGEWSGPNVDVAIFQLARELGVGNFPTYNTGNNLYVKGGMRTPYDTSGPTGPVPPDPSAPELAKVVLELDSMASQVPVDAPWTAAQAVAWDSQSFDTWKVNNVATPSGRALVDVAVEAARSTHPRDVSLLSLLHLAHATGNENRPGTFSGLVTVRGGPYERRFAGGSQALSLRMAEQLGSRVLLSSPVRALTQQGGYVRVTSDRRTVRAREVIVALPPALTVQLAYSPQLPFLRAQMAQRWPQGSAIKCNAVYPRPFWRDTGLNGQAVAPDSAPVRATFDNTPEEGSPGVLVGFIGGSMARAWGQRSRAERQQAVLANFASFFGEQARRPMLYIEANWQEEPWTRGCYSGFTAPGVLLDYGTALRAPAGRIHWAGTETSTYGWGGMEGAVRAGQRAAAEALAEL